MNTYIFGSEPNHAWLDFPVAVGEVLCTNVDTSYFLPFSSNLGVRLVVLLPGNEHLIFGSGFPYRRWDLQLGLGRRGLRAWGRRTGCSSQFWSGSMSGLPLFGWSSLVHLSGRGVRISSLAKSDWGCCWGWQGFVSHWPCTLDHWYSLIKG